MARFRPQTTKAMRKEENLKIKFSSAGGRSEEARSGDPVYDTYMKQSLGKVLPDCLRQLMETRPADPIEFISDCLHRAVENQLYLMEKEKYANNIQAMKNEK
ncbi:flagellar radial spoke protein 2-like [Plakobranchus ocellatus]|uniref:Flagellar radial spoke protein 2-like n=1 Tax=Plakobranchus ocellatus TaxID=259542 RepID=A0AAV4CEA6_9GAST|nr:flagellar radial spoke protein 2-like [Plakobranchus ocellatus]